MEIIKGVKDGIDLFTINFPVLITEANSALIFDLLPSSSPSVQVINLSNTKYIRDWSLLSDNCHCFTCSRKYTKAYLNHLINTHELLVSTLLNMFVFLIDRLIYFALTKRKQAQYLSLYSIFSSYSQKDRRRNIRRIRSLV